MYRKQLERSVKRLRRDLRQGLLRWMLIAGFLLVYSVAAGAQQEIKTIAVWTRLPQMEIVVDLFNQTMKEQGRPLRAEITMLGAPNEAREKFIIAAAAGTPPDVISSDIVQWPEFADAGMLLPLDRFSHAFSLEQVPPGVIDGARWRGQLYGVPVIPDLSVLFLWTRLFDEAGLSSDGPETWDDLAEMAFKLTQPSKQQYGWDMKVIWGDGWYLFTFLPFVWGNGGDLLNAEGDRVTIWSEHRAAAEEAVAFWAEQVERGVNADLHPSGHGFWELAAAMRIDGSSVVNHILDLERSEGERWHVVPIPRPAGGHHSSFLGGDAAGIPAGARNIEEAVEFLGFAMSYEAQEALAAAGNVPASVAYFDNPYFMEEPRLQQLALALERARTVKTLHLSRIFPPFTGYLRQAFEGQIPAREALEQMENEINAAVNE